MGQKRSHTHPHNALGILLRKKGDDEIDTPEISNPLNLKLAIKFALLYAVIVFFIKAAQEWGKGEEFHIVCFLSGLTDMDAIALSLANLVIDGEMIARLAAQGVLIAAVANTIFKLILSLSLGHRNLRGPIVIFLGSMIVFGILGWFLI